MSVRYQKCADEIDKRFPDRLIVFTNGCFDILHPGHIAVLKYARSVADTYGGIVVVGINSDVSLARLKGEGRPIFHERARETLVSSLSFVDAVIVFDEDTPQLLIDALKPRLVVKGGDYAGKKIVGELSAMTITSDYLEEWSTTKIIDKIRGERCQKS